MVGVQNEGRMVLGREEAEVPRVRVRVEKPSAVGVVEGCGVEIVREREWMLEQRRRRLEFG